MHANANAPPEKKRAPLQHGATPDELRRKVTSPAASATPNRRANSPTGSAQDIHRTPPHSVEAEQGVIGSILCYRGDPGKTIAECVEKISADHLYAPAHQTIFIELLDLDSEGQAIDLITFTQHLRDRKLLDQVGGAGFVTSLFTFVPTAANVAYYLDIVRDKYILREIIAASTESVRRAYEEQDSEAETIIAELEERLSELRNLKSGRSDP